MTIREFLYGIRRIAGDRDEDKLSLDMLLTYFTEEIGSVASLFPRQESFTEELSGTKIVTTDLLWLDPKWVYVNNVLINRMYATEIKKMVDLDTTPNSESFWAMDKNDMYIVPGSGTARVIGNFKVNELAGYTEYMLDQIMYSTITYSALDTVPCLTGRRLELVRYRMLRKVSEELGMFDRAQYYLAMEARTERNLRRSLENESTVSNGFILGQDF